MDDNAFQDDEDASLPHNNESQRKEPSQQENTAATTSATTTVPKTALSRIRVVLLIFTAFYTTFYGGALFGWGPMQLLLERDGAFRHKCPDDWELDSVCSEQTAQLLNVQLVAQCFLVAAPLLGQISDSYGPVIFMGALGLSGVLGIALLATAAWLGLDGLLYPAFLLISAMSQFTTIIMVQVGLLFEPVARRRVISALNALFDAGAMTYLILWTVADRFELELQVVAMGYWIPAVLCMSISSFLWRRVVTLQQQQQQQQEQPCDKKETDRSHSLRTTLATKDDLQEKEDRLDSYPFSSNKSTLYDDQPTTTESSASCNNTHTNKDETCDADKQLLPSSNGMTTRRNADTTDTDSASYVPIAERTPLQQLTSGPFVWLTVFFAFMTARNLFVLTTARDFLGYLGDDELNHRYLSIFTLLTPISLAGLPFVDQALGRWGYHTGFQCINGLAAVHGLIQVVGSQNLQVQVLGFVVFSFFRSFLFSVSFSFLPTFLSPGVLGKATGILPFVAGVASFVNLPLADVAVKHLNGNFFWPNVFYTVLVIPNIYIVWRIGQMMEEEEQRAETKQQQDLTGALGAQASIDSDAR